MINLYEHNQEAYENVLEMFEYENKAAVVQPTGTGKMYIALKWLYENRNKKCLYVCPTKAIMYQLKETIEANGLSLKDFPNLKLSLYRNLLNWNTEDYKQQYDCIVLDEFHRAGAPKWGECINTLLEYNEESKVLGLSATPVRYSDKRNMADEIFEGNIASEMTLAEAIARDILPFPNYVGCIYEFEEEINKRYEMIKNCFDEKKREYLESLLEQAKKHLENSTGMDKVVNNHCKPGKYIIFCKDINHIYEMKEKVSSWYSSVGNVSEYIVHSEIDSEENEEILNKFQNDKNEVQLLFAVDMLNEGYHPEGIDGIMMLRKTDSHIIFLQQLGRGFSTKGKIPTVIDVVSNVDAYENIYDVRDEILEYLGYDGYYDERIPTELEEKFKIHGYAKDIVGLLKQVDEMYRPVLSFEEKIEIIKAYLSIEGNTYKRIKAGTKYNGYNINFWKRGWRQKYNNPEKYGELKPEEEQILKSLGEDFERQIPEYIPFEEKIEIIKEYLGEGNTYEDINDGTKYNGYNINRWKSSWRQKYNNPEKYGELKPEEEQILKSLGEDFERQIPEYIPFEEKIEVLKEYLSIPGNTYKGIKNRERFKDYFIGRWKTVFRNKFNYPEKNGKLTQEEEQILRNLGETFEIKKIAKSLGFEEKIEIIKEYLSVSGNTYKGITKRMEYKDYLIGSWKNNWRQKYNNPEKYGELTQKEEQILRSLGEDFIPERKTEIHKTPPENIKLDKNGVIGEATIVSEIEAKHR